MSDSFFLKERPAADPAVKVRHYSTVNVRAGILNIGDLGIEATLFANNLFDKTHVVGRGNFAPELTFVSAIYGPPRRSSFQLPYHSGRSTNFVLPSLNKHKQIMATTKYMREIRALEI